MHGAQEVVVAEGRSVVVLIVDLDVKFLLALEKPIDFEEFLPFGAQVVLLTFGLANFQKAGGRFVVVLEVNNRDGIRLDQCYTDESKCREWAQSAWISPLRMYLGSRGQRTQGRGELCHKKRPDEPYLTDATHFCVIFLEKKTTDQGFMAIANCTFAQDCAAAAEALAPRVDGCNTHLIHGMRIGQ